MSLPDDKEVSRALDYLKDTDEQYAKSKARTKAAEHERKTIKAVAYLEAKGSQGDKLEIAYASDEFKEWTNRYEDAIIDEQIMASKRKRAELTIEVWRSLNANQRRGNI